MQYFAYGSNILISQMAERCPEATPGHIGTLPGWRFLINERGVATITPDPEAQTLGLLWRVGPGDIVALDGYEGVAEGRYERRILDVTPEGHEPEPVIVYVDPRTDSGPPRDGYLEKILTGATACGLPESYVDALRRFTDDD